ncbi:LysR family transcriptional regulator [Breoghania sp.]|uniref:LysR family transcriptional regulator n=1 Tax=Breoghania sp. TaxID=2065378 RepID=UPI002632FACD|nr:LysR family transcriptional regulator [Breoghania sp.]MDJ0933339.1 LysR substrate-binding domain-containing protein [Breoghania sp.]
MSAKNVTLRELRCFVAVADKGSFVRAASVVALSQPALSQSIRQLEEKVGGSLFIHTTRSVNLTPLDLSLLANARHLLHRFDGLMDDLDDIIKHRRGHVTIACLPSIASRLMPRVAKVNDEMHPGVHISIRDSNMRGVTSMLLSGEADLGIGGLAADHADLSSAVIAHDTFHTVVPVTHPLSRRRTLTWKDLTATPFVAMTYESGVRELIDRAMEEAGLKLSTITEVTSVSTLMGMIEEGIGVSALPSLVIPRSSQSFIRTRPLTDPVLQRTIQIYWKHSHGLSPAAQAIVVALVHAVDNDLNGKHFPSVEWDL